MVAIVAATRVGQLGDSALAGAQSDISVRLEFSLIGILTTGQKPSSLYGRPATCGMTYKLYA